MNEPSHDDLDWLAFRYVAAEMSPDEAAQFEERLGEDQECREAVARAVELAEAVTVVSADRVVDTGFAGAAAVRSARSTWWTRAGWIGLGAAAALAGVLLFHAVRGGPQPGLAGREVPGPSAERRVRDDAEAVQLARLWCQTREEIQPVDGDDWPPPDGVDPLSDELERSPEPGAEDPGDGSMIGDGEDSEESTGPLDEVPSWMLAALAGETKGAGDGLPPAEGP